MKIILDKILDDGKGSFFVYDDITEKNLFHFSTQVKDKVKLKTILQKHLDKIKEKKTIEDVTRNEIEDIISTLT